MSEELSSLIPQTDREKLQNVLKDLESYKEVTVTNDTEWQNAVNKMAELKKVKKDLDKDRAAKVKPYKEKFDYINNNYNPIIKNSIGNAITVLDVAIGKYLRQKRIENEKIQAKRDAEAKKKREEEEQRARHDLEVANKLREEGKDASAEKREADAREHLDKAETTVAPVVEEITVAGTHFVEEYEASYIKPEDESKMNAVRCCLSNPILFPHVYIDLKALEKMQKSSKGKLQVDGIKFELKLRSRTRTK